MRKNKLLLLLALLMTAATGARADWTGGTYTATADENLGAITVNGDATLTINSDVTVTVTGGLNITSGTLTVTGPGTLVVNGAKGNNGGSSGPWGGNGTPGSAAISGNIVVQDGATVQANGGAGGNGGAGNPDNGGHGANGAAAISGNVTVQGGATVTATGGNGGNGGNSDWETGGKGGNGGNAFAGTLTYKSGTVTANGGSGGTGGSGDMGNGSSGSAGKAFANDVDFTQSTGYSVTNGTSTIGSVLNQRKVVISGGSEPAASTFTVSLKDGVKDADKWTISPNPAEEGQTVTLQYTGRLKVKGVTATSEPAAPSWKLTLSSPAKDLCIIANGGVIAQQTLDVASTEFTVEMPELTSQTVNIFATDGSGNCWYCTQENMSFAIGQTYQSSPTMTALDEDNSKPLYKITGTSGVTIPDGKTVVLSGVNISGGSITCDGNATIILMGANTVTATSGKAAIKIGGSGTTLTITGSGSLTAQGGGAGIGTDCVGSGTTLSVGNIVINGGTVTATGAQNGAGIGTGRALNTSITCGDITINGGTVTATGSLGAAGIGTGLSTGHDPSNECGAITIGTGVISVTATKGKNSNSIGKGAADGGTQTCGTITIGGTIYWDGSAYQNGGDTYLATSPLIYDPTAQAKPAATVTTAPTGAEIVGVKKNTALVSGGVADGGTLMYAVTTTNTKPTSTAGFSDAVPTAKDITASGTVYVWYYVKGDDTHTDSEIVATAIEVPVADIVWDATNVWDLEVWGTFQSYEKEGVTLSGNTDDVQAVYHNDGDPETDGIWFETFGSGGFTFTAPAGKAFTKIEMKAIDIAGWADPILGTGWSFNNPIVTWKGTAAASTVGLLTDADQFSGEPIISIVFYLSE